MASSCHYFEQRETLREQKSREIYCASRRKFRGECAATLEEKVAGVSLASRASCRTIYREEATQDAEREREMAVFFLEVPKWTTTF